MRVGILGSGLMGAKIGTLCARAGHDVTFSYARSTDKLARLILNRWIRLESEGPTRDIYNRHLAYAMTEDGQCINTVLVRAERRLYRWQLP